MIEKVGNGVNGSKPPLLFLSIRPSVCIYIYMPQDSWVERNTQHKASMKHFSTQHSTFHPYLGPQKEGKSLSWSIVKRAPAYSKETQNWQLCLAEKKTFTLLADEKTSLNKRIEIL